MTDGLLLDLQVRLHELTEPSWARNPQGWREENALKFAARRREQIDSLPKRVKEELEAGG